MYIYIYYYYYYLFIYLLGPEVNGWQLQFLSQCFN